MEFLAALAVAAAIFVFVLAIAGGDSRMRSRLDTLRGGGGRRAVDAGPVNPTLSERVIRPAIQAPVQQVKRMMPTSMLGKFEQRLVLAGEPMTLNAYLTLVVVCLGGFVLGPALLVLMGAVPLGPLTIAFLVGATIVGLMLPNMWLSQRVSQRQGLIIKSLPDAFDLITTCVEAGLGLDAALGRVAEKVQGPFAEELSRTLRDISLGKSRKEAMRELGDRTGVPDLISFVNAVIQAESMGSSVGTVLRVQAEQLRVRRRQRAEAQAYRAPVKMLFPLVLCIFPTLFIVILGPAVITIMQDFPGSK
jgi:tight adherence protein C